MIRRCCFTTTRLAAIAVSFASVTHASADSTCTPDAGLTQAAAVLVHTGGDLTSDRLSVALRDADSDVVTARAMMFSIGDPGATRAWLKRHASAAEGPLVCGEAESGARRLVIVAPRAGALHIERTRGSEIVKGELAPGFEGPSLVIRDAEGRSVSERVSRADLAKGVKVPAYLVKPWRVQLVAERSRGPKPVAERWFPSHSGLHAAARLPPGESPVERVNALRVSSGIPRVRRNRLLETISARYAAVVCNSEYVSHVSPRGEDPAQRAQVAGLKARNLGEVIARASSVDAALDSLVDSPAHERVLKTRHFTDAGFGIAQNVERFCVVGLFAEWPRFVSPGSESVAPHRVPALPSTNGRVGQ